MYKEILNTLSPEILKKRLLAIIDGYLKVVASQMEKNTAKVLHFNQSLLEEWSDLLQRIIFLKDGKAKQVKANNVLQSKSQIPLLKVFNPPAPIPQINSQYILNLEANSCDLFQLTNHNDKLIASSTKLAFTKGYLRKYCSYNFVDSENVVLIGGSRQANPNIKSREIFNLNVKNSQIQKIGDLPYGVSSHATVKIGEHLFIIGGNKDMNIVTKSCLCFNVFSKQITKAANLNYPSASHAAISWKKEYIYKLGGVGSCFGAWDLSPYIERYSLKEDHWQIINPVLKVEEDLLDHYSLFANSLAYATDRDSILIFGGFDFHMQGSNKVLEIAIKQRVDENEQSENQYEIISIGTVDKLEPGGFFQQEPVIINNQLIVIQTIDTKKGALTHQLVSFSNQIQYM